MRFTNFALFAILATAVAHVVANEQEDMNGYYVAQRKLVRIRGLQQSPPSVSVRLTLSSC